MKAFLRPYASANGPKNKLPNRTPAKTQLEIDATLLSDKFHVAPAHIDKNDSRAAS